MKNKLWIVLILCLILTGCSFYKNTEEIPLLINTDNIILKGESEVNDFLESRNNKIIELLDRLNIEYKASPCKNLIYASDNLYEKYSEDTNEYFAYEARPFYEDGYLQSILAMRKNFPIDSKLNYYDPYLIFIFQTIKFKYPSYEFKDFKSKLKESTKCINSEIKIIDDDFFNVNVISNSTTLEINLYLNDCNTKIENEFNLINEYKTIEDFKNKKNLIEFEKTNCPSSKFYTDYKQFLSDSFIEIYTFSTSIDRVVKDENYFLDKNNIHILNDHIQYMSQNIGLDLSKYITGDKLYKYINEGISYNELDSSNQSAQLSTPIGSLEVFNDSDSVNYGITIKLPVIAGDKHGYDK